MMLLKAVLFVALIAIARAKTRLDVEVLSVTPTSVIARFPQYRGVKKYLVNIGWREVATIPVVYWTELTQDDLKHDGFYYIDANNTLDPGRLYEIQVINARKATLIGTADVFTACDEYSYYCVTDSDFPTTWGQACISSDDLCDDFTSCEDGSDEERDADGTCALSLPDRPNFWSGVVDKFRGWAGW